MKKYIFLLFALFSLFSCEKPEEGLEPAPSDNAEIVRFRVYQNQNIYFDGAIDQENLTVSVTGVPSGIDLSSIRPQILVSEGATVTPASGDVQNFTGAVEYTVVSESGENTQVYTVTVTH